MSEIGSNSDAELKRRIERIVAKVDEIAELQEEVKALKAEDKADGFNVKAIMDAVKLRRADAEKVLATLLYEEERRLYRKAAGVPTDLETAQERAEKHARSVPEPKRKKAKPARGGLN